ncbi:hypothetical protein DM02DRAFT_546630 [Periconia macrospinosa]|uniref:HTH psq-type domain-containing protein n=1 Tax=Periconia macrospinosa TaxID=97972 RepID=A0A2V1CZA9_9PLEO|nr:hypothetical protein DM02DRAFT_546630 [Periconia macrospinosa]
MAPRQQPQQSCNEGRLSLTTTAYKSKLSQSFCRLAKLYNVPRLTLQTRLNGVQLKREIVVAN